MKRQISNLILVPTTGAEAYAAMEAEIAAVLDTDLLNISVDIPYAHQIVLTAADRIEPLVPELAKLHGFDLSRVKKLRLIAAACRHAHLLATSPEATDPRAPALLAEGTELRALFLATAQMLVLFGHVPEAKVEALRAGAGHLDMTNDLEQYEILFRALPKEVKAKTPITEDMIARAGTLARELCVVLGVKQFGAATAVKERQRMRHKAYTLMVRAYEECQRGVGYLRARFGDAETIAPSLYVKQRRRSPSAEEPVEPEVVEPEPEPELPVAPATVVTPT